MADFLDLVKTYLGGGFRCDDDSVDRMSHRWTMLLMVLFCVIVGTNQYVGNPIQCWTPAHFTDSMNSYTETYCWISNTYFLPIDREDPNLPVPAIPKSEKGEIGYYQWVPLILLVQALCFHFPVWIWRALNDHPGVNIDGMIKVVRDIETLDPDRRDTTMKFVVRHLDRYLDIMRDYRRGRLARVRQSIGNRCICLCSKRLGNWLVCLYLMIKLVYLGNTIGQIYLLDAFIGSGYSLYGFEVLQKLANGSDWEESAMFPRVTLCDFKMRVLGNVHRHTVQCSLPINLFSEKIYIFIWFWLVFLCIAIILNILSWVYAFMRNNRRRFVTKYLRVMDKINRNTESQLCEVFIEKYLRHDGVFILQLISKNSNDVITNELVVALWDFFRKHRIDFHPDVADAKPLTLETET